MGIQAADTAQLYRRVIRFGRNIISDRVAGSRRTINVIVSRAMLLSSHLLILLLLLATPSRELLHRWESVARSNSGRKTAP